MEKNKKYIIKVEVNGKLLHYTAEVTDFNEHFVTFKDKYGGNISYNWNVIVSYEPFEEVVQ
jgi:hypothetical protein